MAGANRGVRQAEVHPAFAKRPKDLRNQAREIKADYVGTGQRPWQVPREVEEQVNNPETPRETPPHPVDAGGPVEGDLLDIPALHKTAFERPQMNANYADCMKDDTTPGTTGDVQSLKYQMDYNAMEERAFRMRHMTSCRGMAHSMARRRGHGDGRVFENVEKQAADMILAGGVKAVDGARPKPPDLDASNRFDKPPDVIV